MKTTTNNTIATVVRAFATALDIRGYWNDISVDDLEKVEIKGDREDFYAATIKQENDTTFLWVWKLKFLLRGLINVGNIRVIPEDWSAILQTTAGLMSGKVSLRFSNLYSSFTGGQSCEHIELFSEMADVMSEYVFKLNDEAHFVLIKHTTNDDGMLDGFHSMTSDEGYDFSLVKRCEDNNKILEKVCQDHESWEFTVTMRQRFFIIPLAVNGVPCTINSSTAAEISQYMLVGNERLADIDLNQEMQVVVFDPTSFVNSLDRAPRKRTVKGKKFRTKNAKKAKIKASEQKKQKEEKVNKKNRKTSRQVMVS